MLVAHPVARVPNRLSDQVAEQLPAAGEPISEIVDLSGRQAGNVLLGVSPAGLIKQAGRA